MRTVTHPRLVLGRRHGVSELCPRNVSAEAMSGEEGRGRLRISSRNSSMPSLASVLIFCPMARELCEHAAPATVPPPYACLLDIARSSLAIKTLRLSGLPWSCTHRARRQVASVCSGSLGTYAVAGPCDDLEHAVLGQGEVLEGESGQVRGRAVMVQDGEQANVAGDEPARPFLRVLHYNARLALRLDEVCDGGRSRSRRGPGPRAKCQPALNSCAPSP